MSHHGPGYVYALINRSMPDLVKIGCTARSPSRRSSELSAATGIPHPFEIVYSVYVSDAPAAEDRLHSILTDRGHRASGNREFFDAPLPAVIDLMLEVERRFPADADYPPLGTRAEGSAGELLDRHGDDVSDEVRAILEVADRMEHEEARTDGEVEILEDRGDLFREAAEIVVDRQAGSTGLLQRRLRIGYGRAAHILDQLHHAEIVGPSRGTQPREVLVDEPELDALLHELGEHTGAGSSPWWKFW